MQEIEYVTEMLKNDNYSLAPNASSLRPIYIIKGNGSLEKDGFNVTYLFVPKESTLNGYSCGDFAEKITSLVGDNIDEVHTLGEEFKGFKAKEDSIIRVSRFSKDYVPEMESITYAELQEMFRQVEKENSEKINEAKTRYNIKDLFLIPIGRKSGSLARAIRITDEKGQDTGRSYYYDFFTGEFISAYSDEVSKSFISMEQMIKDMHYALNYSELTKDEIATIWDNIKDESINYNEDPKNPGHYIYEPYYVSFKCSDGITRTRISNLYLVKDMNRKTRLCQYGPNNTFRDFFNPLRSEEENYELGWRQNEDRILRLGEVMRAFGITTQELCAYEDVCEYFKEAKLLLRDLTFYDEDVTLWAPYFNNFSYEDIAR